MSQVLAVVCSLLIWTGSRVVLPLWQFVSCTLPVAQHPPDSSTAACCQAVWFNLPGPCLNGILLVSYTTEGTRDKDSALHSNCASPSWPQLLLP